MRQILVNVHFWFAITALILVVYSDAQLVSALWRSRDGKRVPLPKLEWEVAATKWMLFFMWATGAAVLLSTTNLSFNTKLALKIASVSLLTVNGYFLHHTVFDVYRIKSDVLGLISSSLFGRIVSHAACSSMLWMTSFVIGLTPALKRAPMWASLFGFLCVLSSVWLLAGLMGLSWQLRAARLGQYETMTKAT
jgi:hypothetical protein